MQQMRLPHAFEKDSSPVECKNRNPLGAVVALIATIVLAGCGGESVCADGEVLKTVKKLFDQQQFGQSIQPPPGAFLVQEKTATLTSTDKQGGKSHCSVLIRTDLVEFMKLSGTSEADITKIKAEAPKRGVTLTKDDLVNYTVQQMASGQNLVTVLP